MARLRDVLFGHAGRLRRRPQSNHTRAVNKATPLMKLYIRVIIALVENIADVCYIKNTLNINIYMYICAMCKLFHIFIRLYLIIWIQIKNSINNKRINIEEFALNN